MSFLRFVVLLLCLATAPLGGGAFAQTSVSAPDYADWSAVAVRAETAIEANRASDVALESLRAELAEWRNAFLEAQSTNAARIATLNDQISALGPVPGDGGDEAEDVVARRSELSIQLSRLRAPVLTAQEAYRRADGLIGEIDGLLRDRQADALLKMGPSPVNPVNWGAGLSALSGTTRTIQGEVTTAVSSAAGSQQLRANFPVILVFLAIAVALLLRGRRWMEQLTDAASSRWSGRGRNVLTSLISLGQIALPFAGLMALLQALNISGLPGLRIDRFLDLIPLAGLTLFAGRWLAGRVFLKDGHTRGLTRLTSARRAEGRWDVAVLGGLLALYVLGQKLATQEQYEPAAVAVILFPLIVLMALFLFRVCQIWILHLRTSEKTDSDRPYLTRVSYLLARGFMAVAIIGPVLAAIGYNSAGGFLVVAAVQTLFVFAAVAVLQRFVADSYALVAGAEDGSGEALIPVLIGFALAIAAFPVLALIWGARQSFLLEQWTRFTAGFDVGDTRISPSDFLAFAAVFAAGYALTRILQGAMRSTVLPRTRIDAGGQNAIVSGIGYIGIFLAAVIAISSAGIDLSSIAIVAGALSVGIGFGLQTVVSNFVSGIILLIERPVTEGDWIEVGGVMGTVRDISVRSTRIETFDRTDVIVPNADLISGMVTNWTRQNLTGRIILNVGAAYGTDTRKVEAVLREVAEAHPIVIVNPPPLVLFKGFGADSLDFEIRAILRDVNFGLSVRSELNHEIARRFAEEGIEIPFAQRDIWLRNPETLSEKPAGHAALPTPAAPVISRPESSGEEAD